MFPLRDENPSSGFPLVVILIIAVNALVWLVQIGQPDEKAAQAFIYSYGATPALITGESTVARPEFDGWVGREYSTPIPPVLTLFTSMFLHGGWFHIIGNMWFLWIFGDNIEWVMGRWKFLMFYIVGGVAAALLHIAFDPSGQLPMVGASGAIAGVMGAYILLYPQANVRTLITLFYFWRVVNIPAVFYLGVWVFFEIVNATVFSQVSSTAHWAHVGGFLAGMALCHPLRIKERHVVRETEPLQGYDFARRRGYAERPAPPPRDEEYRWAGEELRESRIPAREARKWEDVKLEELMAQGRFHEAEKEAEEMFNWAARHGDRLRRQVYADYLDEIRARKHGPWV